MAEQLGLIAQTLRNWVKAAERGRLNHKARKVSEEQMELSRLRAENAGLKMENEILKKRRRTLQCSSISSMPFNVIHPERKL